MDLYILNPNIELQGIIDGYSSLRWRRRFFEPGEVELHCKASAENLALLRPDNIIHRLDRKEAAIIEGVSVEGISIHTPRAGSDSKNLQILPQLLLCFCVYVQFLHKLIKYHANCSVFTLLFLSFPFGCSVRTLQQIHVRFRFAHS